ncbi:hypothetical protein Taro_048086 [Colocasia esculenta]|uniref:Uncharacterized protein n=1 Tax=Colocasia esculenta TaxID=4460 RepID=A0A843X4S2_COLES|nr:hypothetical protein [Colocasia esculenta]
MFQGVDVRCPPVNTFCQAYSVALPVHMLLWNLGDVLEREWLSRRLIRRLETPRHLSRRSL